MTMVNDGEKWRQRKLDEIDRLKSEARQLELEAARKRSAADSIQRQISVLDEPDPAQLDPRHPANPLSLGL